MKKKLIIAIDFDGTIVEDAYPKVGKAKLFAVQTIQQLVKDGHRIILWTYRSGKYLEDAIAFCDKNNIELEAVNASWEGEKFDEKEASRKINADLFIDDRNLGGFPGWTEVYQIINNNIEFSPEVNGKNAVKKKKRWF